MLFLLDSLCPRDELHLESRPTSQMTERLESPGVSRVQNKAYTLRQLSDRAIGEELWAREFCSTGWEHHDGQDFESGNTSHHQSLAQFDNILAQLIRRPWQYDFGLTDSRSLIRQAAETSTATCMNQLVSKQPFDSL